MFKEALQRVVDGTEGGMAGLLMDLEGIPIDSYSVPEARYDVEQVGAEVSVVVKGIQRANEMLEAGHTKECAFRSDDLVTLIRILDDTYFLALTLRPDGNMGKGRFMMRLEAPGLAKELA